jgi:hypothetical protein
MTILLLVFAVGTLSEEVNSFMDEYRFNGYTSQWCSGVYLSLHEPVSFQIYPSSNLAGVVCGVGGGAVFDLRLELTGGGVSIIDNKPDDMPVLEFNTGSGAAAYTVTVTAMDMLYGAIADSAFVFFAMRPVQAGFENSVPVKPDSVITGE